MADHTQKGSFVSAQRVAELAGVSRSAVSRTFTEGASVSDATRAKVLQAAEALGYHVNHLARGLIHERSDLVCLVAADIDTPFRSQFLDALTRRLQMVNKVAMVINTSGDAPSVARALKQTLNYRAAATVVLSGSPAPALIETCVANGQHVILINRDDPLPGPETIVVDSETAAREAFFLLRRAGCKRLAVVSSVAGTPSILARERGFQQAAEAEGIMVSITRAGPTTYRSGVDAASALFSRAESPDGVFCTTDLLACGFMDAARNAFNLSIPDDLCVIGFDDIEQAGWSSYELTTFRQPIEQVTDKIVALIVGGDAAPNTTERFQPTPVWRRSVRPR